MHFQAIQQSLTNHSSIEAEDSQKSNGQIPTEAGMQNTAFRSFKSAAADLNWQWLCRIIRYTSEAEECMLANPYAKGVLQKGTSIKIPGPLPAKISALYHESVLRLNALSFVGKPQNSIVELSSLK